MSELLSPEDIVQTRLVKIEALLHRGTMEALSEAEVEIAGVHRSLETDPMHHSGRAGEFRSSAFAAQGHAARLAGRWIDAAASYCSALDSLASVPRGPGRDRMAANLWTCRGLALLAMADPNSLKQAARCFDEVIALRTAPGFEDPADRWGLAAAWMNRADAIAGLGGSEGLREAITSTERAREALDGIEWENHPPFRTRLALSWMKEAEFATNLLVHHREGERTSVLERYARALAVLRPGAEAGVEESRRVLAVALTNLSRARLVLDGKGSPEGESEAREALDRLGESESSCPETVALGATARIAVACHLESISTGEERVLEITDLAEEGLGLIAKAREAFGSESIDERLPAELMRLGAEAYLRGAPRFLADFLLDHLDPGRGGFHFAEVADCHEAAVRTLWRGIAEIQRSGFSGIGGEAYEARRELLAEWEGCREQLHGIRRVYFEI